MSQTQVSSQSVTTLFLMFTSFFMQCHSIRLPLSYSEDSQPSPYLHSSSSISETSIPIKWGDQNWLGIIHSSDVIEVSSRGIRSIVKPTYLSWWTPARQRMKPISSGHCKADYQVLCWMGEEGGILPSHTSSHSPEVYVTGLARPLFSNQVLAMFSKKSREACGDRLHGGLGRGSGRNIVANQSVYVVSSCDILNGHMVFMYEPAVNEVFLFQQTFGPMAYSVNIICALACLYGASGEIFKTFPNSQWLISTLAIGVTISCSLSAIAHGIPFATIGDECSFWASVFLGTLYALVGLACQESHQKASDACVYALSTVTIAMYRTPENPYAGILISILVIKQWFKVYILCRAKQVQYQSKLVLMQLDVLATTMYLCLLVEVGLVPQFAESEDWPIYAGIGAYMSFAVALYKQPSN